MPPTITVNDPPRVRAVTPISNSSAGGVLDALRTAHESLLSAARIVIEEDEIYADAVVTLTLVDVVHQVLDTPLRYSRFESVERSVISSAQVSVLLH